MGECQEMAAALSSSLRVCYANSFHDSAAFPFLGVCQGKLYPTFEGSHTSRHKETHPPKKVRFSGWERGWPVERFIDSPPACEIAHAISCPWIEGSTPWSERRKHPRMRAVPYFWERRIRTLTDGTRTRCPTIRRSPNVLWNVTQPASERQRQFLADHA